MARPTRRGRRSRQEPDRHQQYNVQLGYRTNCPYDVPSKASIGTRLHPQNATDIPVKRLPTK